MHIFPLQDCVIPLTLMSSVLRLYRNFYKIVVMISTIVELDPINLHAAVRLNLDYLVQRHFVLDQQFLR